LSGRGLCDELITRPEESYRLCCVVVCDLETSRICAPYIYDISSLRVNEAACRRHAMWRGLWSREALAVRSTDAAFFFSGFFQVLTFEARNPCVHDLSWWHRIIAGYFQMPTKYQFWGTSTKFRKATISFVMSFRLSGHMEQLGSHGTDFHVFWYLSVSGKSSKKIQVSLKSPKNNGHFTWRPMYIFIVSSEKEKCFRQQL